MGATPIDDLGPQPAGRGLPELATIGRAPKGIGYPELHKLTLLSTLMIDREEDDILRLAVAAVPDLAPCTNPALWLDDRGWWPEPPGSAASLLLQLRLPSTAPRLLGSGRAHVYAVPVRSMTRHSGYLVVESVGALTDDCLFPLQVLCQQLAAAIDNARRHARETELAAELGATNALLESTVGELRGLLTMHERLTRVATLGGGVDGIAEVVFELTGRATVIEDTAGVVVAGAGEWPGRRRRRTREAGSRLLERLRREPRPVRDRDRVVALAGHRPDSYAWIVLADPDGSVGEHELRVLEYAATVLAMELARSVSVAEAELRLQRDLIEELLLGLPDPAARARGAALGIDLARRRRVVVIEPTSPPPPGAVADRLLHVLRRVLRAADDAGLLVARGTGVVCLADADLDWQQAAREITGEPGSGPCWIGVGSVCERVADFPASLRHARQALSLAAQSNGGGGVITFDDLGVYRLFALHADAADLDEFIDTWLRPLIEYDSARSADLVRTLTSYLRSGGSLATTSADLTVHRSTVKYRLDRVRALTDHDLTDPATLFSLQLATHALETRRTLVDDVDGPMGFPPRRAAAALVPRGSKSPCSSDGR